MPLSDGPRREVPLVSGWRFAPGEHAGAERPEHDDRAWEAVSLPHSWNAADGLDETAHWRRGAGWYRRSLAPDPAHAGRRAFLRFAGAALAADVWLDGRHVARHEGGFTAFACDATAALDPVRAAVLAVRVDNGEQPDLPPLVADFTFHGGLYRDVALVLTDPVHLAVLDHASPGVAIEVTALDPGRAAIAVRGTVVNDSGARARVVVSTRVLDPRGREVARLGAALDLAAGEAARFAQAGTIERPETWSPESPALYAAEVEVRADGRLADAVRAPLGLRTVAVDPARGLLLNGAPRRLRGTNRHQDRAGYGIAVPDALQVADLERIRADGFDFVRLAHYPQAQAVLDACDRLGLLVWQEIPVVNRIGAGAAFESNARRMLAEMIRQHRHHPSVIAWGLANEVLLLPPDPCPTDHAARTLALARALHADARAEDPTRPTALALSRDEVDDGSGVQDVTDLLGLNLYFGWYHDAVADLGPFLDAFHERHPERVVVVSEYGAESDPRLAADRPERMDWSPEYQQTFHEETFAALEARAWLAGSAVWNQFDFGSKAREGPRPSLNQKGLYTLDRAPKDVAWYYRARLAGADVIHLALGCARRAGSRPGDEQTSVLVYTNADEVELWHDGLSLGRRAVENAAARWRVSLAPGANELVARGRRDGRALEDRGVVVYEDRAAALAAGAPCVLALGASACRYRDADGLVWEPDREHVPGGWGRLGGRPVVVRHRVAGTRDPALFQAGVEGLEGHRLDVPDGDWELELGFVERVHARAGERVFAVLVNDREQATLDLADSPGPWSAHVLAARVESRGGAGVRVAFAAARGEPTLATVKLTRR